MENLEVILKSVHSVLQCAQNVEEMEKKFFEFVDRIIFYFFLDEDNKLIEKEDIYKEFVLFSSILSSDIEAIIEGEKIHSVSVS